MPGGAFKLMWDTLLGGKPFAAYVKNLAKDGFDYQVFATVTPMGSGFLSVRSSPRFDPLWNAATSLYGLALPVELEAKHEGANRSQTATVGLTSLAGMLADAGFPSYDEFMYTSLPAETQTRVSLSARRTYRPEAHGDLADILNNAVAMDEHIGELLGRLDSLQHLAEALQTGSQQLGGTVATLAQVTQVALDASQRVAVHAPILVSTANAMTQVGAGAERVVAPLPERLSQVRLGVMELRFRIALAQLHNDMVINFALENLDGFAPPEGFLYVPLLCYALADDVEAVSAGLEGAQQVLTDVARHVDESWGSLGQFQKFLSAWRIQVPKYGVSLQLGPLVGPIDEQLHRSHEELSSLRDLAKACVAEARPFDRVPMEEILGRINAASRHLISDNYDHTQAVFNSMGLAMPKGVR
jgi:aerotaxis receptor